MHCWDCKWFVSDDDVVIFRFGFVFWNGRAKTIHRDTQTVHINRLYICITTNFGFEIETVHNIKLKFLEMIASTTAIGICISNWNFKRVARGKSNKKKIPKT